MLEIANLNAHMGRGLEKIMKYEEYIKRIDVLADEYRRSEDDESFNKLYEFQKSFMEKVLSELKEKCDTKAKENCYELLEYAVHKSESGSSILYVETKEEADETNDIIWELIGDYMLDAPQIYKVSDGEYAIDCMFGGSFVLSWDGWLSDCA